MSQIIPIYIPTFISDQNYAPARVLPHVYFYNGQVACESFYVADGNNANNEVTAFPYFDNYNVVSGQFPTSGSKSLLFQNETSVYGSTPTGSLYSEYWSKYIELLYNPKTRLLNCSAIIPLADYIKMELNDVVNFRGNYFHLRAINDYSLKTGECRLQLLGPIIADTISDAQAPVNANVNIKLTEYNNSPTSFLDANLTVAGTTYFFSGDFTQSVSGDTIQNVSLEVKDISPTVWGPFTTASANLTIRDNGLLVTSSTHTYYSGSGDQTYTIPVTFTAGRNITVSGSTTPFAVPPPPESGSSTLDWSFTETSTAGTMDIYVNGINITSRNATSTGSYTVYEGDEIYAEVIANGCTSPNTKANAYCFGILTDALCDESFVDLITNIYTVTSGDIGNTLTLDCYASCNSGCI